MDTYYLVRSLVHYFGESLMVSLLLCSYLLTNLFDFFFWEKLIYLTWSHAGQQEHIFENTGKDKHTKGRRMQNFIWLWGEDFEYVWTLTEKIQKTKKNHLVAEKTIGEDGKEMYRELFIRQCAGSNQVPWVSARISFFLLVHNSKHGTAFHHAWTITELLGSGCRTEEGRCCSLAKWQRYGACGSSSGYDSHLCPMICEEDALNNS